MEKKKILFIIPWLPYPIVSGGHQALYSGIKAIVDDYDVYLAYEAWDNDEYICSEDAFQIQFPNIHLLPLIHHTSIIHQSRYQIFIYKLKTTIWNLLHKKKQANKPNPVSDLIRKWEWAIKPQSVKWQTHLNEIFKKYTFDLVQVEMPWFLSFVFNLPKNVKKVYVHHELGFVKRDLELKRLGNDDYLELYKDYIDSIEINILNRYDGIITLSEVDADKLIKKGIYKPVFSSFVSIDNIASHDYKACDGNCLVFVGPESNPPNVIGLSWFLDNCWESLLMVDPSYKINIIGKWNQDHIAYFETKYPNIKFLGYVDNLDEALNGSIMIVPITIGSGIRIKILEACSKGIPFVCTPVGAEGIPVESEIHCFIADDPESFIDGVLKLKDKELQKRFVDNSREMIKKCFSVEALRNNRLNIYESIFSQYQ